MTDTGIVTDTASVCAFDGCVRSIHARPALNDEQSALLVARLAAGGVQRVLARDFGVRQSTVRKVKREAANRKAS